MKRESLEDSSTYLKGCKAIFKAVYALKENGVILSKLDSFCKGFFKPFVGRVPRVVFKAETNSAHQEKVL